MFVYVLTTKPTLEWEMPRNYEKGGKKRAHQLFLDEHLSSISDLLLYLYV